MPAENNAETPSAANCRRCVRIATVIPSGPAAVGPDASAPRPCSGGP